MKAYRFLIGLAVVWVGVIAAALAVNSVTLVGIKVTLFQGALSACITLCFLAVPAVRSVLQRRPTPHLFLLVLFFTCMAMGQLLARSRATFPFVQWNMYGRQPARLDAVTFYEFEGLDEAGNRVPLIPVRLFPSLTQGRISLKLDHMIQAATLPGSEENDSAAHKKLASRKWADWAVFAAMRTFLREEPLLSLPERQARLDAAVRALALRHNRLYPGQPVRAVEILLCLVDIRRPGAKVQREAVRRVDL